MQLQADYFTAYHNLKLTRDDKGVLVAEFPDRTSRPTRNSTRIACSTD